MFGGYVPLSTSSLSTYTPRVSQPSTLELRVEEILKKLLAKPQPQEDQVVPAPILTPLAPSHEHAVVPSEKAMNVTSSQTELPHAVDSVPQSVPPVVAVIETPMESKVSNHVLETMQDKYGQAFDSLSKQMSEITASLKYVTEAREQQQARDAANGAHSSQEANELRGMKKEMMREMSEINARIKKIEAMAANDIRNALATTSSVPAKTSSSSMVSLPHLHVVGNSNSDSNDIAALHVLQPPSPPHEISTNAPPVRVSESNENSQQPAWATSFFSSIADMVSNKLDAFTASTATTATATATETLLPVPPDVNALSEPKVPSLNPSEFLPQPLLPPVPEPSVPPLPHMNENNLIATQSENVTQQTLIESDDQNEHVHKKPRKNNSVQTNHTTSEFSASTPAPTPLLSFTPSPELPLAEDIPAFDNNPTTTTTLPTITYTQSVPSPLSKVPLSQWRSETVQSEMLKRYMSYLLNNGILKQRPDRQTLSNIYDMYCDRVKRCCDDCLTPDKSNEVIGLYVALDKQFIQMIDHNLSYGARSGTTYCAECGAKWIAPQCLYDDDDYDCDHTSQQQEQKQ